MSEINKILTEVSNEVSDVVKSVDTSELLGLSEYFLKADSIFIYGNGRSGLVGKMIAMRLMHSGFKTYVIGETNTPDFAGKDLLVVLSGSGGGTAVLNMLDKVRTIGGKAVLVTAADDPDKHNRFDASLFIEASTKKNDIPTIQPLGNQFDQAMHLILDALILYLNAQNDTSNEDLKRRHFNLE